MGLFENSVELKRRRTKMVATVGPSTRSAKSISRLIDLGTNVFRINMSHGDHAEYREVVQCVRRAADVAGEQIAILVDLCGPKIRVGNFSSGEITLEEGSAVVVTAREIEGAAGLIPSLYSSIAEDVEPGHRILLDDGQMMLRVESIDGTEVHCKVEVGGVLSDHKGMNLPDGNLSVPAITAKDREDVRVACDLDVDFIALSFVCRSEDIEELRALLPSGSSQQLVAKIERPQALDNIESILEVSDAIMVARGDLGVELPPESLPATQDELVKLAHRHRKPVIIATQMLDSMIRNPRPTRAEVADIAHAVQTGVDAVMLSGETAIGAYPEETVEFMDLAIRHAEARLWREGAFESLTASDANQQPMPLDVALSRSVASISRDLGIRLILVVSRSGTTGRVMSSARPAAPILAATADRKVCRQLALCWGVLPVPAQVSDFDLPVVLLRRLADSLDLADAGQMGLIVRGFRPEPRENQPSVTVVTI
jgi:pyruvate kinase